MDNVTQLEYKIGAITVQSKDLTVTPSGKLRLSNQLDYMEVLNYSIVMLIDSIAQLKEAIDTLKSDTRQIRVGNEAFVYGDKVAESDEVDIEELNDE